MTVTEQEVKRSQKPRDVNYELEVVDDLPESDVTRSSPLEDQLAKVIGDESLHGKWVRIGSYANATAATAAANVLRKRHGDDATVEGWTVKPKRMDAERSGLFVRYEPGKIVEGGREAFEARRKARSEKLAAAKAAKGAATGNGETTAPVPPAPSGQTTREQAKGPQATSGTAQAGQQKK